MIDFSEIKSLKYLDSKFSKKAKQKPKQMMPLFVILMCVSGAILAGNQNKICQNIKKEPVLLLNTV